MAKTKVICALLMLVVMSIYASPYTQYRAKDNTTEDIPLTTYLQIRYTLDAVHEVVGDIYRDGKVNCIDYAVTFKYFWDNYFTNTAQTHAYIRLGRIYTEKMNHLFIILYLGSNVYYIEPQATGDLVTVGEVFGDDFDSSKVYYETKDYMRLSGLKGYGE